MMTARQKEAFDIIDRETARCGRSPTYREISALMGIGKRSQSYIHRLVNALEERGFIRRSGRSAQTTLDIVRRPSASEIIAQAPRQQAYTSFRFDENLKALVKHREFIARQ